MTFKGPFQLKTFYDSMILQFYDSMKFPTSKSSNTHTFWGYLSLSLSLGLYFTLKAPYSLPSGLS